MKGWRYEGYRHSLAARGIKTSLFSRKSMIITDFVSKHPHFVEDRTTLNAIYGYLDKPGYEKLPDEILAEKLLEKYPDMPEGRAVALVERHRHHKDFVAKRIFKKGKYHSTLSGPEVIKLSKEVESELKSLAKKIDIAGSIRRKQTPVDIDIVMIPKDIEKVKEVIGDKGKIIKSGNKIVEARIKGVKTDIYFTEPKSYGATLMTYTGPDVGNLGNRTLARNQGKLLNQFGLYNRKTGKMIAGRTEKEIYEALGKKFKEPELRGR